ncbi:ETX/MTX2 family pore-forming toxin [Bacillus sp. FDAARGOS_1420]|uniref:ETX/MTX2 family pore-forming toxin n=1 Tax=unclassified Bacillus (in: firmicutes) TaxID=185979 RepID=UPI001C5B6B86|nr:ETX/MTX2 family pore-forming toxin [Bacillus sp. FDAARGOS_1420]MBW3496796.1 ETX/MTX2 family pore-forming toxin [Bacillus sp. FDAARGOS_1420]
MGKFEYGEKVTTLKSLDNIERVSEPKTSAINSLSNPADFEIVRKTRSETISAKETITTTATTKRFLEIGGSTEVTGKANLPLIAEAAVKVTASIKGGWNWENVNTRAKEESYSLTIPSQDIKIPPHTRWTFEYLLTQYHATGKFAAWEIQSNTPLSTEEI